MPWERQGSGFTTKDRGGHVKNPAQYEKLRAKGMSKGRAAAITNSVNKSLVNGKWVKATEAGVDALRSATPKSTSRYRGEFRRHIGSNFSNMERSGEHGWGIHPKDRNFTPGERRGPKTRDEWRKATRPTPPEPVRPTPPEPARSASRFSRSHKIGIGVGTTGLAGAGAVAYRRHRVNKGVNEPLRDSEFSKALISGKQAYQAGIAARKAGHQVGIATRKTGQQAGIAARKTAYGTDMAAKKKNFKAVHGNKWVGAAGPGMMI